MARLITCGWESGYANGTGAGSDELHALVWGGASSGTVVANPAWWKSSGSFVLKTTSPGNRNPPFALGNWVGFKFGVDGYPTSESDIFFLSAGGFSITLNPNGVINIWTTATGGIVYTSPANTIKVQACHLIEIQAVSGTQQWWLDGVMLFSYNSTNANDIFASSPNFVLGGAAAGWYFDDFYANSATASASNQTGRRGLASVRALVPNADVGSSPAGFTNSGSLTFGNATTGWFSAIDDAPPFLAANADFIGKSTANTVVYETAFADTPNGVTPTAVSLVSILGAASAAAAQVSVNLKANSIDGNAVSYAPAVTTPLVGQYAIDLASTGVAWTKALVDGATAKFGSSTDVTPNPKLFAMYLMYETLDLPKIETLTDTFAASVDKTVKWSNSNAATVWDASGQAKLPCATTYSQLATSATVPGYNLIGSSIFAKMTVPPTGTGTREMFMEVQCNNAGNNKFSMFVSGGQLFGRRTIGGTQSGQLAVTYVPATHAWWRIRESAGTIYFDFSSDGNTWTNHYNVAAGMTYEAVWVSFTCGYYGTETADNGFIDNVNTVVAGGVNTPVTIAATVTLTAALTETEVYKRAVAASMTISPSLTRKLSALRSVAASSVLTPAVSRKLSSLRSFSAGAIFTPVLTKVKTVSGPFTPNSIDGLGIWFDATKITGLSNGSPVTSWADSSGGGHNAAMVDTAPVYRPTVFNGHPAVEFSGSMGSSTRLLVPGWGTLLSGKSQYTMFMVIQSNDNSDYPIIAAAPSDGAWTWIAEYNTDGDFYWGHGNGAYRRYAAGLSVAQQVMFSFHYPPADPHFYIGGVEQMGYALGPSGDMQTVISGVGSNVVLGGYWDGEFGVTGYICEIIWYDHAITTPERLQVENYLHTKWFVSAGPTVTQIGLDASMVLNSAATRALKLTRPHPVVMNFAVTQARKLSAFRTLPSALTLSPSLTPRKLAPRSLLATTTLAASMSRVLKLGRSFNASSSMLTSLDIGSGKAKMFNGAITFAVASKRFIALKMPFSVNFTPTIQRKSTMTVPASVVLNPGLAKKSLFGRIFASVTPFQTNLQRSVGRKISLPASLPFNTALISGRVNRVLISADTVFTATVGYMRFISRKPIDILFSSAPAPAELLAVEDPEEWESEVML